MRYSNAIGYPDLPLIPWPSLFYLQMDVWQIDVEGEYARFEVRGNVDTEASSPEAVTYVREDHDAFVDPPGARRRGYAHSQRGRFDDASVVPGPLTVRQ